MKKSLPANAKISKEAKETVQECVSEFISFITGEASDKCQREKRKTINGDDLLWAMTILGFENYVGTLEAEMDLRSYNAGALCSLGTEVAAKSNGENTRFHGYQENNLMVGDFKMNRIRDQGDRNGSRAMAGQPHHGVSW
ncbi:hypothetical protein OIU77_002619 [Salix suchowensis]|uniref:Transcription factor CBF/NF-Y/archaeal histone domain-containing protein n=1 Tax=Salix suchowensis TaxID=1278906 RepID=A0ABQ9AYY6_9ROSI|nr:hypothetical protein OIU77_002619 [Salix suchowensis]